VAFRSGSMEGVDRLMKLSVPVSEFQSYVRTLVEREFPDGRSVELESAIDAALQRTEFCFKHVALRGYRTADGDANFSHLHGDQFATFLYLLANSAWRAGDEALAGKVMLLNRTRHAIAIMYDTILPDIFVIPHTVGTVIGKGTYGDYLVVCQNVTVANDITSSLTIGSGVILFPGAFVVGTGTIGSGSVITANTTISYNDIPPDSMVRGCSPHLEIWPRKREFLNRFFIS